MASYFVSNSGTDSAGVSGSKTTTGCKKRFGFKPLNSGTASSTGSTDTNTDVELPFGGFPASKAFS